jgi:secreted trypsin-like serine protease
MHMSRSTRSLLASIAALSLLALASCVDAGPVGEEQRPIINGQVDQSHLAVVALTVSSWGGDFSFCSGTVIAPRAILTAGHCVEESGIAPSEMSAFFGTSVGDGSTSIPVTAAAVHPSYYVRQDGAPMYDVAVLTLSKDAPVPPMAWQRTPLADISGKTVTLVGYGVTNAQRQSGDGTRRVVDLAVTQMDESFIYYGDGVKGTCQGDSGGPMFLDVNGTLTVVGVTSWGDQSCVQIGGNTRVDVYSDFITPLARVPVDLLVNHPVEGEVVGGPFDVDVSATSLAGIAEVDVFVDDEMAGAAIAPPFVFPVAALKGGAHVIKVRGTGMDQTTNEKIVNITVATVTAGGACSANSECTSGICAEAGSGNGFCTQSCQTNADCPGQAACNTVSTGMLCGPPGSAAGGCNAGGSAAGASLGLLLLGLALCLATRRRR